MTDNWAKGLKDKSRYLIYSEKEKKAKRVPQKFGTWLTAQKVVGSIQSKKEVEGLSEGDANELVKHFGVKK